MILILFVEKTLNTADGAIQDIIAGKMLVIAVTTSSWAWDHYRLLYKIFLVRHAP